MRKKDNTAGWNSSLSEQSPLPTINGKDRQEAVDLCLKEKNERKITYVYLLRGQAVAYPIECTCYNMCGPGF